MTLDAIKNEIKARLREVRADSSEFNVSQNYQDLQKLISKTIGKVELCENAEELEALDGPLTTIEELYNACVAEESGEPSNESLFDFDFELDDAEAEADEPLEEEEEEEDLDEHEKSDNKHTKREAKNTVEKDTVKKQGKAQLYTSAKKEFDKKYPPSVMKKPNLTRLCVGLIALVSGILSGLITAQWWPFEWWAWSIIGLGVSYLIITVIYAIVISVGKSAATRQMSFTRLILAGVAVIVSLVLGIVFEFELTLVGAYIATLPFTAFGIFTYLIYRIRLFFIACGIKKRNKTTARKKKTSEN